MRSLSSLLCVVLSCLVMQAEAWGWWSDAVESEGVVYFFSANSSQVSRYDLARSSWRPTLHLPPRGGIASGHVDSSGMYVACGASVFRYGLDGNGETLLLTTNSTVRRVHADGALLIVNHASAVLGYLVSANKTTGEIVASVRTPWPFQFSALDTATRRVVGVGTSSPLPRMSRLAYTAAGTFPSAAFVLPGDPFSARSRVWTVPGEGELVTDGGILLASGNFSYLGALGQPAEAVAFAPDGRKIVAHNGTLTGLSPAWMPLKGIAIGALAKALFVHGGRVAAFSVDASRPEGVLVSSVPLSEFVEAPPPPPLATGAADASRSPVACFLDSDGVLLLLDSDICGILRWDTASRTYLTGIGLSDYPVDGAYSPTDNTLYVVLLSGRIVRVRLSMPNPVEEPFLQLPNRPASVEWAGAGLFIKDNPDIRSVYYTYDAAGEVVSCKPTPFRTNREKLVWSGFSQRMLDGLLHGTELTEGLLSAEVNVSGALPGVPIAGIGAVHFSLNGSVSGYPIATLGNSSSVILSSGQIYHAATLLPLPPGLGAPAQGALVVGSSVYVRWNESLRRLALPGFNELRSRSLGGNGLGLFRLPGNRTLSVSSNAFGRPSLDILDEELRVIPPPVLRPPTWAGLAGLLLTWRDDHGEESYRVERSRDGGAWSTIGQTAANITTLFVWDMERDSTYRYRLVAVNGSLESDYSEVLEISTFTPPPPSVNVSAVSDTQVRVEWVSPGAQGRRVEYRRVGGTSWTNYVLLLAFQDFVIIPSLEPGTPYEFRVSVSNAFGTSEFSAPRVVSTWSRYQAWIASFFGTSLVGAETAPLAENGNRVPNLLEYAFGLDPRAFACPLDPVAATPGLPLISFDESEGALCVWLRRRWSGYAPGIEYIVEFSSDLSTWEQTAIQIARISLGNSWELVKMKDTVPGPHPRRYGRVRIVIR